MAALAPIGMFARFIITAGAATYANWDAITKLVDRAEEHTDQPIFGQYLAVGLRFKTPGGTFNAGPVAQFGIHLLNTTGGNLDTSWTTDDYTSCETDVYGCLQAIADRMPDACQLEEFRWYPFGPGVVRPNPADRIAPVAPPLPFSSSAHSPYQLASSVTLRTPIRKHWGRFYLPLSTGSLGSSGMLSSTTCDLIASSWRNCFLGMNQQRGITPVVWDRVRHTALGVTEISVDDVPDIIRRRRPPHASYHAVLTS